MQKFRMILAFVVIHVFVFSQAIIAQSDLPAPTSPADNLMPFVLMDGTPVKLRIGRTMSSADAKTGETVDFEVLEEVMVGETVVIARGSTALATVAFAKPKARMGKGGKLDIVLDSVRMVSGEKIALRASKDSKGGNKTGAMTGAIVATSIVFFPAAPLFLFMKGKDITVPKGTEITAYVTSDIPLDIAKFRTGDSPKMETGIQESTASIEKSDVSVKSDPEGADIEIDGRFVGNTPSTFQLEPGEYKVVIKKAGFVIWERTITLGKSSNINLNAALEINQ